MLGANGDSRQERDAVYGRNSTDEQAQAGTIENQFAFARRYAELHGLDIHDFYGDEGVSGTVPLQERAAGQRLLADAKAGKFNTILVYRLDRLARKLWHLLDAHDKLSKYGVSIRSMTEPLDTSTPIGRFIFQLLGSIAELERETILERSALGMERVLASGKPPGRTPYGLARDAEGRLALHPTEAAIVQAIFTWCAAGTPAGTIARDLTSKGIPPMWSGRRYKNASTPEWRHTAVLSILHNPVYWSGEWRYERKNGTVFTVPAPPLVERATAIMAHRALAQNNQAAKRPHRTYLLSGLIRCGVCDVAWVGGSSKGRPYYTCRGSKPRPGHRHVPLCPLRPIRADQFERQVWADIKAVGDRPGQLAEKLAERLSESAGQVEAARQELQAVEAEYTALTTERLNAMFAADRHEISREELSAYLRAGAGRVHELERLRVELAERIALRQVDEARIATVEDVCRRLRELIAEAEGDPMLQQKLVRAMVRDVTMQPNEDGATVATIDYLVADPTTTGVSAAGSSTPDTSPLGYDWCTTQPVAYRQCGGCGVAIFTPRAEFCQPCRRERKRAAVREAKRRAAGYVPRQTCLDCGAPLPTGGWGVVRCRPCQEARTRQREAESHRRQRAARAEAKRVGAQPVGAI